MTIRLRLTLLYALGVAFGLVLAGVILHLALPVVIRERVRSEARRSADALARRVTGQERGGAVFPLSPVFQLRLYDQFGPSIRNSSGVELPDLTPGHLARSWQGEDFFIATSDRRVIYVAPLYWEGQVVGAVQVGQSLEPFDDTLRLVDRILLLYLTPLGALLAAALGYVLAGRALSPVERFIREVDQVSAESLDRRLVARRDELGRLAERVNSMLDRLARSFEIQRDLIRNTTHELKVPLTNLVGYTDRLSRKVGDAANRDLAERAARVARYMRALVEDLLALARGEAMEKWETRAVELSDLLHQVREEVVSEADPVRFELNGEVFVEGDPIRLKQACINLIKNAKKAVDIKKARLGQSGEVAVRLDQVNSQARIAVIDTGIGIPADEISHIFERFYQCKAHQGFSGGTGLGLTITKLIVERHKGTIDVSSVENQGSTFTISLPAMEVE
ncbi:MAG: HAMP domain-containing histidine kinase [Deinococcus sp.]|nr:HAMP domain-containing histidine kinase [Deinococcus sp.]